MERAVLYARVSSEEQVEGYSIDAQRRAFQQLCDSKDWIAQQEYIDEGKSAHNDNIDNRTAFQAIISDALAGKFDVLVVHKLDRFSRNLRTTLEYFDKLLKVGVSFVSINEQMDFTTPSGKVHLALLGAFAQYYSDNLSQETKKGWAERRAQGLYCGSLPFGTIKGEDGIPIPDPDAYPGLVKAFQLAAQDKTDREVAIELNSLGYRTNGTQGRKPFSAGTVGGILKNRFYLGEIPDNGDWIKAKHEPFIETELFNTVQTARENRIKIRNTINTKARTYSLSTLMWCHRCNCKMRIQMSPRGRARIYCSGRAEGLGCNNRGTFLDTYEAQIEWYLDHFIIPEEYQDKMLEIHRRQESTSEDIKKQREALHNALRRLKDQYKWGHISKREYFADYQTTQYELEKITSYNDDHETIERLANFLNNIVDAWRVATQEQRNKMARSLFDRIVIEDNRVVFVKPKPELEQFFRMNFECHTSDIAGDPEGI